MATSHVPISNGGTLNNVSWQPDPVDPLSLIPPMVIWHKYFESRGFKDWSEAYTYFSSVAKLTGEMTSDIMLREFRAYTGEDKNAR